MTYHMSVSVSHYIWFVDDSVILIDHRCRFRGGDGGECVIMQVKTGALILAWKCTKSVWWPGTVQTCCRGLQLLRSPDSLAGFKSWGRDKGLKEAKKTGEEESKGVRRTGGRETGRGGGKEGVKAAWRRIRGGESRPHGQFEKSAPVLLMHDWKMKYKLQAR